MNDYGTCEECNSYLEPIWFVEEETTYTNGIAYKTGRKRRACACLVCPSCLKEYPVDDTFDGHWCY